MIGRGDGERKRGYGREETRNKEARREAGTV
jgi:hypothetical protein